MASRKEAPSLELLCLQSAIDRRGSLGDVGSMPASLLEKILRHCGMEQLIRIEDSTKGRDLSEITDGLWKKFYEIDFGVGSGNIVVTRMEKNRVKFHWRSLYEEKAKKTAEAEKRAGARLKQRYAEEEKRKQSRQIKLWSEIPLESNKRSFPGSSKGNLMKKARSEFLNSYEARNCASLKKAELQRKRFPSQGMERPSGSYVASR